MNLTSKILTAVLLTVLLSCKEESSKIKLNFSRPPFELKNIPSKFAKDVSYGEYPENVFDIFLTDSEESSPLVIYIHGGGFRGGDKSGKYKGNGPVEIGEFLKSGISFASINYRLLEPVDTAGVLKSLNDSKRCLQFIRYHAKELNIDKNRIALYGSSAGSGTCSWLGFSDEMADPDSKDPILRESTRVCALGLIETQASYDMHKWETVVFKDYGITLNQLMTGELEQRFLSFYGISDLKEFYSPRIAEYRKRLDFLSLITRDDPEFWMKNSLQPLVVPKDVKVINHHAFHAKVLKEKADSAGLRNVTYIPLLNIKDPSGETLASFFKRKLLNSSCKTFAE